MNLDFEMTMTLKKIIKIDEEKCDGCGSCISKCPGGALKLIDGKARFMGVSLCDSIGACIGKCPQGAITLDVVEIQNQSE